jgi:tetratricopeptide (TPR) repeat protein
VEAAAAFARALQAAPPGWQRRRQTVESLVLLRMQSGDARGCAELATAETADGPRDSWWANLIVSGLPCAGRLSGEAREAALPTLLSRAREALALPLGADDRSLVYEALVDLAEGDEKHRLASEWMQFLEAETQKAAGAEARAAFDSHRLEAAVALGDPARAIPALEASERDLPRDYNAPARLALAYLELGRYDDGLAACDRALKWVYGPRRLRVEETRANLYKRKGDREAARRTLEEAIRAGEALPPSPRATSAVARLRQLLGNLR